MTAWPVIVLYHLYAGVAGLIQYTSVGADFASYVASISGEHTFPLFTALSAAAVSIFVPSSGGQWVVQGFITTKAAAAVGVSAQRGLLALSVGDHVGNLVSPFWAVIAAGIARIDFRVYIGYNMIYVVLWFVLGVLCFTFFALLTGPRREPFRDILFLGYETEGRYVDAGEAQSIAPTCSMRVAVFHADRFGPDERNVCGRHRRRRRESCAGRNFRWGKLVDPLACRFCSGR